MKISEKIRERLKTYHKEFKANDNIANYIEEGELELLQAEVQEAFQNVLESLVIDTENDHNTNETARRVAKMYVQEIFKGRYTNPPKITSFPNVTSYDQLYIIDPISIRSVCSHHFQNIRGKCYVGVFPGTKVIGLSKFHRIVDWISSRPQIQEELSMQIATKVQEITEAEGIAVAIRAEHSCCTMRGIREEESYMTTSAMLGKFRDDDSLKQEFLMLIAGYMK